MDIPGIYLDYNATTPLDESVALHMDSVARRHWGNPSSIHQVGQQARALLDQCRYQLSQDAGCKPSEIVFTGGGTESDNLALLGTARRLRNRGKHLITTPIEHPAVLECMRALERHEGFEVSWLPVDGHGQVDPAALPGQVRPDTVLVSVMAANNEIGTLQPVQEIGHWCREQGILFHTDAVQVFGKLPFASMTDFGADLVSLCAHKFHGPRGSGALYIRSPHTVQPILWGGAQENERRGGTENLSAVAGLAHAFHSIVLTHPAPADLEAQWRWTRQLRDCLASIPGVTLHGHPTHRLPNTVAFSVADSDSLALLANLDLAGIRASSGSACSVGSLEPSHVLQAIGASPAQCRSLVRFSLGRATTEAEIHEVVRVLPEILQRSRRRR
jgi:cysteine desulfurase